MSPPLELSYGDWNSDTAASSNVDVQGDTFSLATAIPDSVVSQYEFEDDADTTTLVDSISSNNLTNNGGVYSSNAAVGQLGYSVDLSSYGRGTTSTNLITSGSTTGLALAGWLLPGSSQDSFPTIVTYGDGSVEDTCRLYLNNGRIYGQVAVGGTFVDVDSGVAYDTASYQHAVVNITSSSVSIYVDNVAEGSTSHSLDITTLGSDVAIGMQPTSSGTINQYGGLVDDVHLANAPLSSQEVDSLYQRGV